MSNWQRLGTKIVYQNPWITVHEDNVVNPHGKPTVYGWIERPLAVFIVALGEDGKVTLVKQLRYTTGQPTWEVPAGGSQGEEPLASAKRELEEEAHLHADKWVELAGQVHPWNAFTPERNVTFIAQGLHKAKKPEQEVDDYITEVKSFSWSELKEMIKNAEITDGQTITALARAGLHLRHFH
jgi:8-oxo-dGTP pyrophosphatase MutT (NUDIX family)